MKKFILIISLLFTLLVSMTSCTSSNSSNVETIGNDGREIYSVDITAQEKLIYDANTKIVYISQYTYNGNYIYTPYLSKNGFPYKYVDGRLVEIMH